MVRPLIDIVLRVRADGRDLVAPSLPCCNRYPGETAVYEQSIVLGSVPDESTRAIIVFLNCEVSTYIIPISSMITPFCGEEFRR